MLMNYTQADAVFCGTESSPKFSQKAMLTWRDLETYKYKEEIPPRVLGDRIRVRPIADGMLRLV